MTRDSEGGFIGRFGVGRVVSTVVLLLALAALPVNLMSGQEFLAILDGLIVLLMAYLVVFYWPRMGNGESQG